MQLTDSQILEELLKYSGLSQKEFAERIGGYQPVLSKVKSGERDFSKEILRGIAKCYPEISLRWLLLGEGEMLIQEKKEQLIVMEPRTNYLKKGDIDQEQLKEIVFEIKEEIEEIKAWKDDMDEWMSHMVRKLLTQK